MHTLNIPDKNIHVEYPSCWDELSNEQHEYVLQQLIKLEDKIISIDEFKLLVLYKFLGIEYSPFDMNKEKRMEPEELENKHCNVWQLTETLNYFFNLDIKDGKSFYTLNYDSIINFIPEINISGLTFYGPDHGLTNSSFSEFRHAFDNFKEFSNTREEKYLNMLVAILYRPEKVDYEKLKTKDDFDGQRREKLNLNRIQTFYFDKISEVPYYIRYGVYLFFRNCEKFIREGEIDLAGKKISFRCLFSNSNSGGENLGFPSLLYSLANEGTFGNIKETDETDFYDILLKCYDSKLKYDEIKRKNNLNND